MPIESVQFISEYFDPGVTTPSIYTVPVLSLAVVTDIAVVSVTTGRQIALAAVYGDGVASALLDFDSAENPSAQWHGRFAVTAGNDISYAFFSASSQTSMVVSGYLYT